MRGVLVAIVFGALVACVANPPDDRCVEAECLGGECLFGGCPVPCATDAECASLVGATCGLGRQGTRVCVPDCHDEYVSARSVVYDGYVCVGDVSTSCDQVDESYCEECGCEPPTTRCEPGIGCTVPSDVGGPCLEDDDCLSANCSAFDGVCRVPLAGPCAGGDCDLCLFDDGRGTSFCSRYCTEVFDYISYPGDCPEWLECVSSSSRGLGRCQPRCGLDCRDGCQHDAAGGWCDTDYRAVADPLPLGAPCKADADCRSGDCYLVSITADPRDQIGLCTRTCTSDADCTGGGRCADVPCAPGQSDGCGALCLPSCSEDPGYCLEPTGCNTLGGIDGAAVAICDPRRPEGHFCDSDGECRSLHCGRQTCGA